MFYLRYLPCHEKYPPLQSYGGNYGMAQMQHFVTKDNLNTFRLTVAWQYVQPVVSCLLNDTRFASYDLLMQGCLTTGFYNIIDIYNYARLNSAIIGQGGSTNEKCVQLWSLIATKYIVDSNTVFGIINEPYNMPDRDV
jgi:endoglucanase